MMLKIIMMAHITPIKICHINKTIPNIAVEAPSFYLTKTGKIIYSYFFTYLILFLTDYNKSIHQIKKIAKKVPGEGNNLTKL
jgi:hypothetical protein